MIETESFDVDDILTLTEGNPLFVTEVMASGTDGVPLSARDAVHARASMVSREGRRVLDLVSVVPGGVEKSLVDKILQPTGQQLAESLRQGLLDTAPEGTADFYGWIIKGDYKKSAAFWRERGIPYEEGLALMHGDESEQIEAIRIFEDLGATATANKVRRALMDRGVRVPRGKSRATRDHAVGFTARQAEVLDLLAESVTNVEIADRLFVSHRTVENHVSAVLMKLDVPDRDLAVSTARDQGILSAT